MARPEGWKGSDLRARGEVSLWLKQHGGRYEQSDGLIVGRMRTELGKGRALSQLLADMEADGMIRREINGRRTMSIELLDDWGLADDLSSQPVFRSPSTNGAREGVSAALEAPEVEYEELAAVLLERVIKQAHAVPSQGAAVERLQAKVDQLTADLAESRAATAQWMADAVEQQQQAETMRQNLLELKAATERKPKKDSVALRDALAPKDRALLDRLMREVPTTR